jgi:hypothetical protein
MAALGWLLNLGFGGDEVIIVTIHVPGMEWKVDASRLQWTLDTGRLHWKTTNQ